MHCIIAVLPVTLGFIRLLFHSSNSLLIKQNKRVVLRTKPGGFRIPLSSSGIIQILLLSVLYSCVRYIYIAKEI